MVMSIFVTCSSAYSPEEARQKIAQADDRCHDILKHFWISEVGEPLPHERERAAEYGVTANSGFLIQWNKEGGAEYIPDIPRIIYEVFGRDKILVFDLNDELIPPS
ncbi:hypothetical protein C5688_08730 [Methylocystis sp. MitZ-2018]|nr:hypothetical protein C5688_08730 [Methylocystis sp. MitZ-2018]